MRNNAILYPFTAATLPIVRHYANLQESYGMEQVIALKGSGLSGKDAACICNQPPIGVTVIDTGHFNVADKSWSILLVDCDNANNYYSTVDRIAFFRSCLAAHKKVLLVSSDYGDAEDTFKILHADYPENIILLTADTDAKSYNNDGMRYSPLSVPVLLVGGLTGECDSLEVILSLKEQFKKEGRIISCLTGSNMGLLLGLHSYNGILNNTTFTEAEKILKLNCLVKNIIQKERPELIIVEAPDAVMKFNDVVPNGFGIRTYMISQALSPDFFICCMPYGLAFSDFIEPVSQSFHDKYGYSISAVHISNELLDSSFMFRDQELSSVHVDGKEVVAHLKKIKGGLIPVFDVISQGADEIYQHICGLLN